MNTVQALIDALALELGSPVGVDDRRFRALAYSAHPDDIDAVRRQSILRRPAPEPVIRWLRSLGVGDGAAPVRAPHNPSLGMAARICIPVCFQDTVLGFLWLLDEPERLGPAQIAIAQRTAGELGSALYRIARLEDEERTREAAALRALADDGADPADVAAAVRDAGMAPASHYACLSLRVEAEPEAPPAPIRTLVATAVEELRRTVAPHHLLGHAGNERALVVLAAENPQEPERRAVMLQQVAERRLGASARRRVVVGVSGTGRALDTIRASAREADLAAHLALAVDAVAPVAAWDRLGAYRTVLRLTGGRPRPDLIPTALRRLLADGDAAALVPTLEAYLEHGGDAQAAAATLFLHRSSLYNRLHRIEAVMGVDLRSGDARLELQLGLRIRNLDRDATTVAPAVATARRRPRAGGAVRA